MRLRILQFIFLVLAIASATATETTVAKVDSEDVSAADDGANQIYSYNSNDNQKTAAKNSLLVGFVVNNNGDAGDVTAGNGVCETGTGNGICTLRAAVQETNVLAGDDTITFAVGITNVLVASEISINAPAGTLTINGNGANVTTIDGGSAANRLFNLNNATVTITGVTLSGGRTTGHGGGIIATSGTLVLDAVTVQNNQATTNGASSNGGGVYVTNTTAVLRVTNSTFSGNSAWSGGGLAINIGTIFVANSTFSDNTARGLAGGGIALQSGATGTVRNITVTNNRMTGTPISGAQGGGGIRVNGSLNIGNSLVAGNTSTATGGIDIRLDSGTITSAGGNLIGDNTDAGTATFGTTGTPNANNDYVGTGGGVINPMLAALDYASTGTTRVHLPMTGSLAIDRGVDANAINPFNNQPLVTDQRGVQRIFNGGANPLLLRVDIGAVEFNTPTAALVSVGGRVSAADGRGVSNCFVYLTDSNGNIRTARTSTFGYYRFDDIESGETYVISVISKRFSFAPQVVQVNDNIADLDFIAAP